MGWDCYSGALPFKNTSERKNTEGGAVKCRDEECREKIMQCNHLDGILYEHYKEKLEEITKGIEGFEDKVEVRGRRGAKRSDSKSYF